MLLHMSIQNRLISARDVLTYTRAAVNGHNLIGVNTSSPAPLTPLPNLPKEGSELCNARRFIKRLGSAKVLNSVQFKQQ